MEESLAALELEKAFTIRYKGNEGMIRVLARRAAGLAIREYLENKNFNQMGLSLNSLLKDTAARKLLPTQIHNVLDRLSTRIGMDFSFPADYDLLLDAKCVIEQLSMVDGEVK